MSIDIVVRFMIIFAGGWWREVVVHEDAMCRAFHVLELAAFDRPEKDVSDDRHKDQAERDEEVEDVHESGCGEYG